MFSLFYGLWKYVFSKTEFHVLILGIDKAGKTVMHHLPIFCLDYLSLLGGYEIIVLNYLYLC